MNKLLIVWKSENDVDINNFITPFAINSKKQNWFDEVEVLIWGASSDTLKENKNAQKKLSDIVNQGIRVYACKFCSDNVGASDVLTSLGVNVMYTGAYLSDKLKDKECEVITI